ncbi:MAG: malonyl-CoA synthase [Gammaproteobacteria bacterium]|nr:malonyl-CoA synthase [Gammaproteobacteria bacterium]MDH5172352.1 malonyl-CoA synthase [Gammaproteobacteria bacterium]
MSDQANHNLYCQFEAAFPEDLQATLLQTADGVRYCYADARRESARLANYLTGLGARPGDRVTAQVEKSPQVLWLYLACLRAGLVYHPLNTAYQASELEYFLGNAEPRIVVCTGQSETLFNSLAAAGGGTRVLTLDADGSGSLAAGALGCTDTFDTVVREADDLAALLYSSGTTGRPKGIMLSHANLASNGRTLVKIWGFTAADVLLHALPVFHVHGLFIATHCVLLSGARMRWLDKFDAGVVMAQLPDCSVMMGVPTYYTRLLAQPGFSRADCGNMRLFISGSAPLLAETFAGFEQRTGHRILERYGMTETGMNTSNPLHGERRAGTVGPPLPDVEVRVVGGDGMVLPAGEAGDLQVRGPNVFKGYWRMPQKTRDDFTGDGFFNTGDKASISEDGYVSIVGRSKDMIICGGLNVYPKEIELVLDDLEGVLESAVIGVPHADFGEAVVAVIVPAGKSQPHELEIIELSKLRLANFKVPKRVFFLEELPRNAMGKVQKNLLRERYADSFSAEV